MSSKALLRKDPIPMQTNRPRSFSARCFCAADIARWKRLLRYGLPACLAVLVLLFCGMPKPPITVASVPASSLQVRLQIDNQYTTTPSVTIHVSFLLQAQPLILSGNQHFACDGASFPQTEHPQVTVERQPPGGAYTCLYTDEQGKRTSVSVVVPQGTFAITSPTADASVSIPASTHVSSGTPPPDINPYYPNPAYAVTMHYTLPVLPPRIGVPLTGKATCGTNNRCGVVDGQTDDAHSDRPYSFADINTRDGQGFDHFVPGPGSLELTALMHWEAPQAVGFASVLVFSQDTLTIPVTWKREQATG